MVLGFPAARVLVGRTLLLVCFLLAFRTEPVGHGAHGGLATRGPWHLHGAAHALLGPSSFLAVHKCLFPWEAVLPSGDLLLRLYSLARVLQSARPMRGALRARDSAGRGAGRGSGPF